MAVVLLLHHVLGLTPGMQAFAETLRDAGHEVSAPDLFDGRTFVRLEDGLAFARGDGVDIDTAAAAAAAALPAGTVYIGVSLGVMPAQRLAQTRAGAAGAVLIDAAVPVSGEWAFGPWPASVPVQVHGMEGDPIFADEGDLEAARELVAAARDGELFLYPGRSHLFVDRSASGYDADAAGLLSDRVLAFLARLDAR